MVFSRENVLAGFILLLLGGGMATAALGQSTSKEYVSRITRQARAEAPAVATQKRLRAYDPYIKYFSGLVYTRSGVTVDPNFVRALIVAESNARPEAVSEENAIGLMQIRPETGRRAARTLYESGYHFRYVDRKRLRSLRAQDLKEPAINILIGCYLLDRYNAAFGNHLARTIGAWNAGPERIRQYEGTPPFPETLNLIARVNSYYLYFRRR
ncbi:MAG: lytic murein transglycosylase [Bacteroidetes bacterium QH_7_62_13]|nr:MAG: lytic murein transglycosylase [Bacteroidetes bacterium QH_7_62_13]